ncbi:hypothetical protein OUZ56_029441 [Daphnia magna]|uniref:Uncharacterized protein n=1 Tax=Daphnia magna TaxID=35525 RepID=A0ABR0B6T5_9CRUS|nr:hypothetical protein OUZ56_029441 [Daphnia magna]
MVPHGADCGRKFTTPESCIQFFPNPSGLKRQELHSLEGAGKHNSKGCFQETQTTRALPRSTKQETGHQKVYSLLEAGARNAKCRAAAESGREKAAGGAVKSSVSYLVLYKSDGFLLLCVLKNLYNTHVTRISTRQNLGQTVKNKGVRGK